MLPPPLLTALPPPPSPLLLKQRGPPSSKWQKRGLHLLPPSETAPDLNVEPFPKCNTIYYIYDIVISCEIKVLYELFIVVSPPFFTLKYCFLIGPKIAISCSFLYVKSKLQCRHIKSDREKEKVLFCTRISVSLQP